MSRAFGWGIGLLAAAALCGFLNIAGAYSEDAKVIMGILAGMLFVASLLFLANGATKRTVSHQDTSATRSTQSLEPKHRGVRDDGYA